MRRNDKITPASVPLSKTTNASFKLIEHSYAGVILLSENEELIYSSPSVGRITGWKPEDIKGQQVISFIHPDDVVSFSNLLSEAIANLEQPLTIRCRIKDFQGRYMFIDGTLTNLLAEADINALALSFVDVPLQIDQGKLTQSNYRSMLIARATNDALFEWDLITQDIWWSESHYTLFGFDPAQPLPAQSEWLKCLHSDAQKQFGDILHNVLNGSLTQWDREVTYRHLDGSWGTLLARGFVVFDGQKPIKILGSFIDISDRLRTELQQDLLAEISRAFRESTILQHIMEKILSILLKLGVAKQSTAWLLGADGKDFGSFFSNAATPSQTEQELAFMVKKHPSLIINEEGLIGVPLYYHEEFLGVLTLFFEDGNPLKNQEQFWDTLGRQLGMEVRNQQMSEQLRLLFDRAPDMVGVMGVDRFFKSANPAMCKLLEYTEHELLATPLDRLIHPDDLIASRERTKAFIAGGSQTIYFENRFLSKSGKVIWLSWTVTKSGEEGVMFCVGKNISDKKEMELLLQKANELARIGGWEVDRIKGTAYWSPITKEIYEVPENFIPSVDNWLSFYREGPDRDYIAGKMADVIATGNPCDAEVQMLTGKGNIRWVRAIAEAEFVDGQCVRVYGSFQDIDSRKKAELAAIDALEERDKILESIADGFFAVDKNWITTYWNTAAEKVMGRSRDEMVGNSIWDNYPEVTKLEFYHQYQKAVRTGQPVHFEDFYPPKQIWFSVSAYPSANGLSVFFRDITESKRAAEALAESEKRYSELFHLSPLPKFVYEMSTLRYLDVNLVAIQNYGYSREEFLSMTILDIRPPEDIPLVMSTVAEHEKDKKVSLEGLFRHRKKNGEIIQVDIQTNIIMYQGVQCKVVVANDVTERVRYIEAIEAQNQKLKDIAWMQSHIIRAPLSRIMGLLPMIKFSDKEQEQQRIKSYLEESAHELDKVIHSITDVTNTTPRV